MAKKVRKNKKNRKPNVFVQDPSTTVTDIKQIDSITSEQPSVTKKSQRNPIVTNAFSYGELIKMGYITSAIFVILIILTFILG
ncbi:MAG: hypothetical protein CL715_04370 [Chloroflexi bacterium]|nr:hypothetical protein [Chloroflexota bacterium]|tara:strand:+ start:4787 stop:5035 length:249 start_codon:yes stop_codon:yes gene_type:complete